MNPTKVPSVLVWDTPVRVFHWLLVLCFFGAFVSAESERWRLLHITLGYTAAGLVVFRLLWGLVGTRHARFTDFVRGPRAVAAYLKSLLRGQPEHHVGHNPAGAFAIVALLGLAVVVSVSGWGAEVKLAGEWLAELHEAASNLMLGVVALHVLGVVVSSWLHRENLVLGMLTGRKPVSPQDGIRHAWHSVGVLMLVAVLGFWWTQWQGWPAAQAVAGAPAASAQHQGRARDDD